MGDTFSQLRLGIRDAVVTDRVRYPLPPRPTGVRVVTDGMYQVGMPIDQGQSEDRILSWRQVRKLREISMHVPGGRM